MSRFFILLFSLYPFFVGCSTDKERVIENEKLKINNHLEVFNELFSFDVQNDSITGMDINRDGNIFIWKKGMHVKISMEKAGLSHKTMDLLTDYRKKLESLNFTGIVKYKDFVKLTRDNELFSSACYHIRKYQEDIDYSGENIFKLFDGIFLHFEKCGSI